MVKALTRCSPAAQSRQQQATLACHAAPQPRPQRQHPKPLLPPPTAAAALRRPGSLRRRCCAAAAVNGSAAAGETVGVVIVDHGSRKAESNDTLFEFAALYRRVTGRPLVEVAHMELAEPTIEQAVARCVAAGASRVIVAPYFLSRGRHVQHDIPDLVAAAAAAHPGVECVIAEPIGIDSLMAQLIENRVAAAEAAAAGRAEAAAAAATAAAQ
ncbi:hypothetical protein ABPG75_008602 [Micractinium tetrahymenae]